MTVAVPVHNGEPYIGLTLDSILAQSHHKLDVVVLDNASTDSTLKTVRSVADDRVRIVRSRENIGAVANWNRALDETRGEFFKLVCADDLLEPNCVEQEVAVLRRFPQVALVAARRKIVGPDGSTLLGARGLAGMSGIVSSHDAIRAVARSGSNPLGEGAAVMIRSEVIGKTGRWDGSLPYLIDIDYWCRALDHGNLYAIQEPLASFRVHARSWSASVTHQQAAQFDRFSSELAMRHPYLSSIDIALGRLRARALAVGRRALYMKVARQHM